MDHVVMLESDVERGGRTIGLVPDIILPSQFDDLHRNGSSSRPEHRLMAAVLEDAIRVYRATANRGGRRSRRLFREIEEWFASAEASWPFSFVVICEKLDLEPEYVRAGLRRWRAFAPGDLSSASALPPCARASAHHARPRVV